MLTATGRGNPGTASGTSSVSQSSASGMRRQSSSGSPIATAILPSGSSSARSHRSPTTSRRRGGAPSSNRSRATQRVPLPHAPASLPSALKKRSRASASSSSSINRSWSNPTPRCRSPMRRSTAGVSGIDARRPSRTTKSLPQPCIFSNGTGSMRRGIDGPCPARNRRPALVRKAGEVMMTRKETRSWPLV